MRRDLAIQLIHAYTTAWVNQDLGQCLAVLGDDVVITEYDGTAFRGIDRIRQWFSDWHQPPVNGRVDRWIVEHIVFDEYCGTVAAEWEFERTCCGETSLFHGASSSHSMRKESCTSVSTDGTVH
ncbi:nuclear transport factor 2 family protein [Candidatus Bipolaricaulota bacterium]|nr:nuclear transport factor 2 family protein [Candidatus Bipolaricaulota bacterium]